MGNEKVEIDRVELKSLMCKARKLEKIARMIDDGVIDLYIRPGSNFCYGESFDDVKTFSSSVCSLSDFDVYDGLNLLTTHPFMIEDVLLDRVKRQSKRHEFISTEIKSEKSKPSSEIVNIYLMKNLRNGYIKIGQTKGEPTYREQTLQSQEPEIELMFSFKSERITEQKLHEEFASKRLRGEWFDLSDDDVTLIKSRINQNSMQL